jgi:hypothetical protein
MDLDARREGSALLGTIAQERQLQATEDRQATQSFLETIAFEIPVLRCCNSLATCHPRKRDLGSRFNEIFAAHAFRSRMPELKFSFYG